MEGDGRRDRKEDMDGCDEEAGQACVVDLDAAERTWSKCCDRSCVCVYECIFLCNLCKCCARVVVSHRHAEPREQTGISEAIVYIPAVIRFA
jgi:hypothetical protein